MIPPFRCCETITCEWQDQLSHWQAEVIAVPIDCGHHHWYREFDAKLRRLHPDLRFGFDRKRGFYVVFKETKQVERLKAGDGLNLSYLHHFIDIVIECKQMRLYDYKGGLRHVIEPRMPGEWVFHELASSHAERFAPDGNWGMKQAEQIANKSEAATQKQASTDMEDLMLDHFSLAGRGDPAHARPTICVPDKTWEKAEAAT